MATFDEVVASAIAREGTEHAFGVMGSGTVRLVHELNKIPTITYHAARHEGGVVAAAEGYARAGGGVGVGVITWGPAFTNSLTSLVAAKRSRTPLVLVTADASTAAMRWEPFARGVQSVDTALLASSIGVPVVRARVGSAARDVASAFAAARSGSQPVVLVLPLEYGGQPADAELAHPEIPAPLPPPDAGKIRTVADMLRQSERPLVLGGRGAAAAGAGEVLMKLADRTGALLTTSLRGVGLFSEHPYNTGIAGGFAPFEVTALLSETDCIVAFGASLNVFTAAGLLAEATIVQCDNDPTAFNGVTMPHETVLGDARIVAEAILSELGEGQPSPVFRQAADELGLGPDLLAIKFDDMSQEGALDPRAVCHRLDELLPRERTVVVDGGQMSLWPIEHMTFPDPQSLQWMVADFGSLGGGLGAATGAALAQPSRSTVLIVGDGALFMALGDLDMAIRDRVPMLIVCLNDRAYGSELWVMVELGLPLDDSARFDTPDLAELARAMGCEAERITRLDQLDSLGERLQNLEGPLFLDCLLTQELVPSRHRG